MQQLGGKEQLQAAMEQLGQQMAAQLGAGTGGGGTLAGPSEDELAAVTDALGAQRLSMDYCKSVLGGMSVGLHPMASAEALEAAKTAVQQHDSLPAKEVGRHRSQLLPSGIILHYQEWGSESAPPIVLLHDINETRNVWDGVARIASHSSYRVLALDMRGHGDTTRSSRRLYALDDLVSDLEELVVQVCWARRASPSQLYYGTPT